MNSLNSCQLHADKNSMNSCQLNPTHYMTNNKLKRVVQMNGSRMKDME